MEQISEQQAKEMLKTLPINHDNIGMYLNCLRLEGFIKEAALEKALEENTGDEMDRISEQQADKLLNVTWFSSRMNSKLSLTEDQKQELLSEWYCRGYMEKSALAKLKDYYDKVPKWGCHHCHNLYNLTMSAIDEAKNE
jgi:hypothetical protein